MADDTYIAKIDRPHASLDYQWALRVPNKPLPKPLTLSSYEHACMIADGYVSLKLTGLLEEWRSNPLKHRSLEEDALVRLTLSPLDLCWEFERTKKAKGYIASKASRYMKLSGFRHVIFVAVDIGMAEDILDELPRNRGTLFILTLHEYMLLDPLMQGYVSANKPTEFQYLQDILSSVRTDGTGSDTQ